MTKPKYEWGLATIFAAVLIAFFPTLAAADLVITYDPASENKPLSATGIEIDGARYDVEFHYNLSFNDLWTGLPNPSPTPTFWDNKLDAQRAAQQLVTQLNIDDNHTNDSWLLLVPYGGDDANVFALSEAAQYSTITESWMNSLSKTRASTRLPNWSYATFTAVPEPSTWGLLSIGTSLFAWRRWRRRKHADGAKSA